MTKKLHLQMFEFNNKGECIIINEPVTLPYELVKQGLLANDGNELVFMLDSCFDRFDVVLGDRQDTEHYDDTVNNDSAYCVTLYSFDKYALRKAITDKLMLNAIPNVMTKHEYRY